MSFSYNTDNRPIGVTLIAIWNILGAILILALLIALAASSLIQGAGLAWLLAGVLIITVPINIIIAWGLWNMTEWARVWSIVFSVLSLVLVFCNFNAALTGGTLLRVILNLTAVIYLLQPDVRSQFRR